MDEDDGIKSNHSRSSDSSADNDHDNDNETSGSEAELMVTTRIRRATAGNRYNNLVAQEQANDDADDDVALLFAEIEGEDEEYHSDELADDADMSSSDDDDQGPNAAQDDLAGEKELQDQAKADKARKRKAELALTSVSGLRKRPKIDPTSLRRAPGPKPTKRKERVSWLPDQEQVQGRISLRKQTIAHREETHAKLKENEAHRLKQKAIRAQREREREADAPRELTQADRIAEAERVERRNAKSLNRWEAMERKRTEEQAARLAALKDRKLEGAVLSFHSARHKYVGYRNKDNIDGSAPVEGKKRGRKPKALLEQLAAAKLLQNAPPANEPIQERNDITNSAASERPTSVEASLDPMPDPSNSSGAPAEAPNTSDRLLDGIYEDASVRGADHTKPAVGKADRNDQIMSEARPVSPPGKDIEPSTNPAPISIKPPAAQSQESMGPEFCRHSDEHQQHDNEPFSETAAEKQRSEVTKNESQQDGVIQPLQIHAKVETIPSGPADNVGVSDTNEQSLPVAELRPPLVNAELGQSHEPPPQVPEPVPQPQIVSIKNLVILDKFDALSSQARNQFSVFYNNRKMAKPVKHTPELCLITGLPARYRDPQTGLGYHNASAFKKLQELQNHQFTWSSMLGCYVGRSGLVARGVPEGFIG